MGAQQDHGGQSVARGFTQKLKPTFSGDHLRSEKFKESSTDSPQKKV
jgi:hypothetical protein